MAEFDLGLDKLLSKLNRASAASDSGRIYEKPLNYLGNKALRYAKENTNVISGRLRREWAFEIHPESKEVTLYNNVEYARLVNDGHRQTPGRYVPALGKRLKAETVPGQHMLEKAIMKVKAHDLARAQRMALDELKKELGW